MTDRQVNINKKLKLHFFLLMASCFIGTYLSGPPLSSMPTQQWIISGFVFGFLSAFPLFFFIPTVLKPTPRNVSWLGFFILAYLVWSILRIFSAQGFMGGLLITTFNITTFFYVVLWLRPFKKIAKNRKNNQKS
jgi:uncharacterized membrane protein